MRHYKSWLRAFVETYASLKAPEPFKYWTAMATLAGALERKVWWSDGNAWFYPNLYLFLIGERSTGKSTIAGKGVEMLYELPDFTLAPTQMNEASLIATLTKLGQDKRFKWHGKDYPNSSFFMFGSEGAKLFSDMGSKGNNVVNTVTDLFNCGDGPWSNKPASRKATRQFGIEDIYNPCINLFACSTSNWLMTKILSKQDVEGGLGSRMLFCVWPEESAPSKRTVVLDEKHFEARDKLLEDLKLIAKLEGNFVASQGWLDCYDRYQEEHEKSQRLLKFQDPMLQGCLGRKANTHVVKLSMLLAVDEQACLPGTELKLEAHHAKAAWKLLNGLEETMTHAFGSFGVSHSVKNNFEVMRYLQGQQLDYVSMAELAELFKKQFSAKELKDIISDLRLQGHLVTDKSMPGFYKVVPVLNSRKPGRPVTSL